MDICILLAFLLPFVGAREAPYTMRTYVAASSPRSRSHISSFIRPLSSLPVQCMNARLITDWNSFISRALDTMIPSEVLRTDLIDRVTCQIEVS